MVMINMNCPKCKLELIKVRNTQEEDGKPVEGLCDCEYVCMNPECRGMSHVFPRYYGYTQQDIDGNVK